MNICITKTEFAIVDKHGFFKPLLDLLDCLDETRFSSGVSDGSLYRVVKNPRDAPDHLSNKDGLSPAIAELLPND